jgi:hypothetical protein
MDQITPVMLGKIPIITAPRQRPQCSCVHLRQRINHKARNDYRVLLLVLSSSGYTPSKSPQVAETGPGLMPLRWTWRHRRGRWPHGARRTARPQSCRFGWYRWRRGSWSHLLLHLFLLAHASHPLTTPGFFLRLLKSLQQLCPLHAATRFRPTQTISGFQAAWAFECRSTGSPRRRDTAATTAVRANF